MGSNSRIRSEIRPDVVETKGLGTELHPETPRRSSARGGRSPLQCRILSRLGSGREPLVPMMQAADLWESDNSSTRTHPPAAVTAWTMRRPSSGSSLSGSLGYGSERSTRTRTSHGHPVPVPLSQDAQAQATWLKSSDIPPPRVLCVALDRMAKKYSPDFAHGQIGFSKYSPLSRVGAVHFGT